MDGWRVRRCVDGLDKADFIIDSLTVQPATKLKVSEAFVFSTA